MMAANLQPRRPRRLMWVAGLAAILLAAPRPASAQDDCRAGEDAIAIHYTDGQKLSPDAAEALLEEHYACARRAAPDHDLSPRVVAGHLADSQNFTDVVKIEYSGGTCTGVLIALDTVLTAAHCACGAGYSIWYQYEQPGSGRRPGFARLKITGGPVRFPGYRCTLPPDLQPGRDLAIIRIDAWQPGTGFEHKAMLAEPFGEGNAWSDTRMLRLSVIRPTHLVLGDRGLRSLYLVGFGRTEDGVLANEMRAAYVGVLSRFCLVGRVYSSYCAMYREFALARGGLETDGSFADSCGGDSGGPVFRMDSEQLLQLVDQPLLRVPSSRTLVGIVSRAIIGVRHPYRGFCGGGGIYSAVGTRQVLDWLAANGVAVTFSEDAHVAAADAEHEGQ